MRKKGLKDVKRRNRQVIMETVLENSGLSRVEIAQKTELAASTVSALVTELLAEGILVEAGSVGTAGRSRTALMVNPGYGCVAVIEIGRRESRVTWFDMLLRRIRSDVLSRRYVAGNELLSLIVNHIHSVKDSLPPLAGLGLLFQEDMRESDFRVMYSTGISSASITLKEALVTQYRVPVEEEYSVVYTVTHALAEEADMDVKNSAHISVGNRVLARVTLNGNDIPLRSEFCEELACAMENQEKTRTGGISMVEYLSSLMVMLCMLFPLETVFLSGNALPVGEAAQTLHQSMENTLTKGRMPQLKFLHTPPGERGNDAMAAQLRRRALVV